MALTGSLREVEPADVFQLISMARKTGVLTISSPNERAQVYFQDGRPVHATCEAGTGEEAVYNLLSRSDGDFSFEPAAIDCPVTIMADMQTLMLEGVRRVDHIRLLRDSLPAPDAVLETAPGAPPDGPEGDEDPGTAEAARALLALVDGNRTMAQLVKASGLPGIVAHEALHHLISQKRIAVRRGAGPGVGVEAQVGTAGPYGGADDGKPSAADIQRLIERIASL